MNIRNQESILKAVFQESGAPAYTYLIDRLPARNVDKKYEIHFDLATAKDILEWFFNSTRPGYPTVSMWHDNESDYLMHKAMTRSKTSEERIQNLKEYHEYLLSQYLWAPLINTIMRTPINIQRGLSM